MSTQIANALSARVLMLMAGIVVALFVGSGIIASNYGQHAEGTAGTIGAICWFGFLIGAVVLITTTAVSLGARAISRAGTRGSSGVA